MTKKIVTILFGLLACFSLMKIRAEGTEEAFKLQKKEKIQISFQQAKKIIFYDSRNDQVTGRLFTVDIEGVHTATGHMLFDSVIDRIEAEVNDCVKNKNIPRDNIKFLWGDDKGSPLGLYPDNLFDFVLAAEESSVSKAEKEPLTSETGEGGKSSQLEAREELIKEINLDATMRGAKKYVMIIFDEDLKPRDVWPASSSAGDLIYVGITRNATKGQKYFEIDFSPCNLEPEAPQVYIGDTTSLSIVESADKIYFPYYFPPRRCYNSSVDITVKAGKSKNEIDSEGRYNLRQYNRYRATLQGGILFTDQHEVSFGLKTENGSQYIFNKGPVNNGPEYTVSLVVYSFLRYIPDLFSGKTHFSGRDIVNDQTVLDRLGAVIGVGLTSPGKRFMLGMSFEVAYGINLIGVFEFARLVELGGGLSEGAQFNGAEDSIPLHSFWSEKLVFGLSLDLRYITAIFSKR